MPALADVRPAVEREWTSAKRRELAQEWYASLRAKYKVNVQMPPAPKP
jgi:hypothetical protein